MKASDGESYEYRMRGSRLERRCLLYSHWALVRPDDFIVMSPDELRHVADIVDEGWQGDPTP